MSCSCSNSNTNSSCNGSVVDGTNRIQILTCKTKNINESFALSFLGEVSPQIFGTDGEIAILSSLTNLSSVKDADVKLFRKVLSHYNNEEIVQYESATSICDENGTSFALVYLTEVEGYKASDALPLIKMTSDWTQTIHCNAEYNSSDVKKSTLSFSYNGETSWSIPINANAADVKRALEGIDQLDLVDVKFASDSEIFCASNRYNPVIVTIRKVNNIADLEEAEYLLESSVPLIEMTGTSGVFLTSSDDLSNNDNKNGLLESRRSKIIEDGNDKPEYHFHVSGSQYVNVVKGKVDFSLNHKTSIKIDKECHENSLSYQLIFVLCEIEKLSSPIQFISSTPFVVYPGSPKNMHVIMEPSKVSSWPTNENDYSPPNFGVMPTVALIDNGGNLAKRFSGCTVDASLNSGVPSLSQGLKTDTLLGTTNITFINGIANYSSTMLSLNVSSRGNVIKFSVVNRGDVANLEQDENGYNFHAESCVLDTKQHATTVSYSRSFQVVGSPYQININKNPPLEIKSGDSFDITAAVTDENNKNVFQFTSLGDVEVGLYKENDLRCPLYCATLGQTITKSIKDGIVTFSGIQITLPSNTPIQPASTTYHPEVQVITLKNPTNGTFRLRYTFDNMGNNHKSYITSAISWNASASESTQNDDSLSEDGLGESMQSKLQSIPNIGKVSVRRIDLSKPSGTLYSERKWFVTFASYVGNVPPAEIYEPKNLATNSTLLTETLTHGDSYYLTVKLTKSDGSIREATSTGFQINP